MDGKWAFREDGFVGAASLPLRCGVAGAGGLLGRRLTARLAALGATDVRRIGRASADLADLDLLFLAVPATAADELAAAAPRATRIVDLSDAARLRPEVPLVLPGVAPAPRGTRRVATPDCMVTPIAFVLDAIRTVTAPTRVVGTTLQAASGLGRRGMAAAQAAGLTATPACGEAPGAGCGDWGQERALAAELRRVLGLPELAGHFTAVRCAHEVGHAADLVVETATPTRVEDLAAALEASPRLRCESRPESWDVAGVRHREEVLVARLRPLDERRFRLWLAADNLALPVRVALEAAGVAAG